MRGPENADRICEEAKRLMEKGYFKEAEEMFGEAFGIAPNPASLNNWAVCRFYQGDPEGALQILQPNLASSDLAPFARALAARAYAMLGRNDEALKHLNRAIADFEEGLARLAPLDRNETTTWREYTVILKQAAGDIGKAQLVIDLFRRHEPHHVSAGDGYLAGAAAFNLGRMDQAVSFWSGLSRLEFEAIDRYIDVACNIEAGVFPKFPLEYSFPSRERLMNLESAEDVIKMTRFGSVRMIFLSSLLDPEVMPLDFDEALGQLSVVIEGDAEWGIQLAESLLAHPGAGSELRAAAAAVLTQAGIYSLGEPINIVDDDGTESQIIVESHTISLEATLHSADAFSRASKHICEKEYDKALATLFAALEGDEVDYRIYLAMATALMGKGNLDQAMDILMMLNTIVPEHPLLLLKLAEVCLQRGEAEGALVYLDRIDARAEGPALKRAVDAIRHRIELERFRPGELGREYAELLRARQEKKMMSVRPKLSQVLRNMPVQWLNGACAVHGIDPTEYSQRKERAEELEQLLTDKTALSSALAHLDGDEMSLMKFLMGMGGWARLSEVVKGFGSMAGDGCWWNENPPVSTLGKLVSKALAAVGSSTVDGERTSVVAVPLDLRPMVAEYVNEAEFE